ncbi:hypothetical protein [uncultured Sphingomonas sp.]|uniref:hypothetical protein n=1 Tax=uncultured Sphingomonas sp. TaxID=158754 RepID=UPI0035C9A6C2
MSSTAKRSDPDLWDKIKKSVIAGEKGGEEGEWSARKAQLAVAEYKKQGGGYEGKKKADNSLAEWTKEDWGTKSGAPSGETQERYLPRAEREKLTASEYDLTTAKKRADTKMGKQYSAQPADVASKTNHHDDQRSKALLYRLAKEQGIPGRSKMSKADLARALK